MALKQARAIVAHDALSTGGWKLEHVSHRELRENEVLVRIVASGICLADVHHGDVPAHVTNGSPVIWYPRVLGHEGSGYVEQVGSGVKDLRPSDPVLLSYRSCGACYNCDSGHPAYCINIYDCNFRGEAEVYKSIGSDRFDIGGAFFGQSSFASMAIVNERCVVSLASLNPSRSDLQLFAPLGCGVQTGVGAFTNIADVQAGQDVAVLGVGGVGQSAIMAASLRGCKTIIAIDRVTSRLDKAKTLGATHVINTSDSSLDLVSEVKTLTSGHGVHVSLDTTGFQPLAKLSWSFVRCFGKVLQVGLAREQDVWDISMADHMNSGKQIIGCVQGDAVPQNFAPQMIGWYHEGRLPIDKLVSFYPVEEYERALSDMKAGTAIKPVLLW